MGEVDRMFRQMWRRTKRASSAMHQSCASIWRERLLRSRTTDSDRRLQCKRMSRLASCLLQIKSRSNLIFRFVSVAKLKLYT